MSTGYRIAVVGAGAAGLCAARHLVHSKNFKVVVFEATDHVGGTWFYTDLTDTDENGHPIHSSMYKDLRTNLPKQVMAFPDFPFDESLPSFLHHQDVLQYLINYSKAFDLQKYIKLSTYVEEVKLIPSSNEVHLPKWEVKTINWKTKSFMKDVFDGVMVCNGQYSVPNIPSIPGMDESTGKVLHSHHYRKSDEFANQRVVVFGANASGVDIAVNLSNVAETVYISHKGPNFLFKLPGNIAEVKSISSITQTGIMCEDGESIDCDSIMFCTGYEYSFPFMKDPQVLQVVNNRITPLYKHLVHIYYPNLSFIGMCRYICPFPQFHYQVLFAMAAMDGTMKLPSTQAMLKDQDEDYQRRVDQGLPVRGAHVLGPQLQGQYNDELADRCKATRIPHNVSLLYKFVHERRTISLLDCKNEEYVLSDTGVYCLKE